MNVFGLPLRRVVWLDADVYVPPYTSLYLPISPYISLYLPISPYISAPYGSTPTPSCPSP